MEELFSDPTSTLTRVPEVGSLGGVSIQDVKFYPSFNLEQATTSERGAQTHALPEKQSHENELQTLIERVKAIEIDIQEMSSSERESRESSINPYLKIGSGSFSNAGALKLANMDFIFRFTGPLTELPYPRNMSQQFTFSCVGEGPGGFVEYIQFRVPRSLGYGMTLRTNDSASDWDLNSLNLTLFKPFYGSSGSGDLLQDWKSYVEHLATNASLGIDLYTADATLPPSTQVESTSASTPLHILLVETLIGLKTVKGEGEDYSGGTVIMRMNETVSRFASDLLLVLAHCFREIRLFKPVMSGPTSQECYVICMRRRASSAVVPWIERLEKVESERSSSLEQGLIELEMPLFSQWLAGWNVDTLRRRLKALEMLLQGERIDPTAVDVYKCLIVWRVPGVVDRDLAGLGGWKCSRKPSVREARPRDWTPSRS